MAKYNIIIKRGTDFVFNFRFRNVESGELVDLTGTSGVMKIEVGDAKYSGSVVIDDALNVVRCKVEKAVTAVMLVGIGRYDIDMTMPNGDVLSIFSGEVEVIENVNV